MHKRIIPTILFPIFALLLLACSKEEPGGGTPQSKPNILLIIADDMGLDATPGYNIGSVKPNMPNLESIMNTGIRFNNLWSNPVCTPTRASILTGKYGVRTNVLKVGDELSTTETSLQRYLDNQSSGYAHAVVGKWHLSTSPSHPTDIGVGYYAGLLGGGVQSYFSWGLTENEQTTISTEYTTSKFSDLAIDWIGEQSKPWFLWLAYNAPHTPFHLPPDDLHFQGNLSTDQASIDANPLPYYMAMLEALDTEMGRVLASMTEEERANTIIIFIGDNGTPNQVAQEYNSNRVKGTIYKGGINVPMIISGKGVDRSNATDDALLNTTDLFATIADIAETRTASIHDSKSFKHLLTSDGTGSNDYIYAEVDNDASESNYTIRNASHKYLLFDDGTEALYNLNLNAFENPNLLSPMQAPLSVQDSLIKDQLTMKLVELRQ